MKKPYTNKQLAEMFNYLHTNNNSPEIKLLSEWERTFVTNRSWMQHWLYQGEQFYHLISDKQWAIIERIANKLEWE